MSIMTRGFAATNFTSEQRGVHFVLSMLMKRAARMEGRIAARTIVIGLRRRSPISRQLIDSLYRLRQPLNRPAHLQSLSIE